MLAQQNIWPGKVETGFPDSTITVLKFGGTSVKDRESWEKIKEIVILRQKHGLKPFIVHSAISGVSNLLSNISKNIDHKSVFEKQDQIIDIHKKLCVELDLDVSILDKEFSRLKNLIKSCHLIKAISIEQEAILMASGELMASVIGGAYLNSVAINTTILDARNHLRALNESNSKLENLFLSARADDQFDQALVNKIMDNQGIFITQGFIASNNNNETVLLGRGGSDTSGAYFASKTNALRLEIWTDVRGFFDIDPKIIPNANPIMHLSYDEAQEIASAGGSVLHPRTIPSCREKNIPIFVLSSKEKEIHGSLIDSAKSHAKPEIIALAKKSNISVISINNPTMWQEVGFLSHVFDVFKAFEISIDLISTSESNITVSIDTVSQSLFNKELGEIETALKPFGQLQIINDCSCISLIGNQVNHLINKIYPSLDFFESNNIYLFTHSASGLNISIVIDSENEYKVINSIYENIFEKNKLITQLATIKETDYVSNQWWHKKKDELIEYMKHHDCLYVYDKETLKKSFNDLKNLNSFDHIFYSMKANSNEEVLKTFYELNASFECVSRKEIELIYTLFPKIEDHRVLFTPNFVTREELVWALSKKFYVTIDNEYIFSTWPEALKNKEIFLRIDTGYGEGHHEHVKTGGDYSKFGITEDKLPLITDVCNKHKINIIGLHAHSGSGIKNPDNWCELFKKLLSIKKIFTNVQFIDIGGGLAVTDVMDQNPLDLKLLDKQLSNIKSNHNIKLFAEPGRYLVANAGILLARVTQLKEKGNINYLGIATGMNSLIRPALYGAYHQIVNLSKIDHSSDVLYSIVGPICETGDRIGRDRWMPKAEEGDIILIANAGAYGKVMSSNYNLRGSAEEVLI